MPCLQGREVAAVVHRLKTDLHNCVGYIQDPKLLKDSIKAMYHKHVHEDTVSKTRKPPVSTLKVASTTLTTFFVL